MIDIHTHILPGMDDGSPTWEDTLEMAQMAADAGTEVLVATSHANLPGSRLSVQDYRKRLEMFRALLREERIPLMAVEGMEIFADEHITDKLDEGILLPINQGNYVLTEFALNTPASFIYRISDRLLERGYIPVIAHPERYECVQNAVVHIYEWYMMGTAIQLNKGSLFGRFGRRAAEAADSILRHRLASVVASDAHSPVVRTPDMSECYRLLGVNYGRSCPELLLEENPARIVRNEDIVRENPVPYVLKW